MSRSRNRPGSCSCREGTQPQRRPARRRRLPFLGGAPQARWTWCRHPDCLAQVGRGPPHLLDRPNPTGGSRAWQGCTHLQSRPELQGLPVPRPLLHQVHLGLDALPDIERDPVRLPVVHLHVQQQRTAELRAEGPRGHAQRGTSARMSVGQLGRPGALWTCRALRSVPGRAGSKGTLPSAEQQGLRSGEPRTFSFNLNS